MSWTLPCQRSLRVSIRLGSGVGVGRNRNRLVDNCDRYLVPMNTPDPVETKLRVLLGCKACFTIVLPFSSWKTEKYAPIVVDWRPCSHFVQIVSSAMDPVVLGFQHLSL